jgi:hypothetical protein
MTLLSTIRRLKPADASVPPVVALRRHHGAPASQAVILTKSDLSGVWQFPRPRPGAGYPAGHDSTFYAFTV